MSCGNPHEIDCVEILRRVDVYIAHDTDDVHCAEIRHHLDECRPCLEQFDLYDDVRKLVSRCCGGEVAPESLRQKLHARLTEVQIEIATVEYRSE